VNKAARGGWKGGSARPAVAVLHSSADGGGCFLCKRGDLIFLKCWRAGCTHCSAATAATASKMVMVKEERRGGSTQTFFQCQGTHWALYGRYREKAKPDDESRSWELLSKMFLCKSSNK
jgi:hypothetical protein